MKRILRGLLVLVLVFSFGAALGTRVDEFLSTASSSAAHAIAAAQPAPQVVDAQEQDVNQVIQQVVQRSNDEQVQAIAARDPSAMSDTVSAEHYQELVRVNQDLLDSGVVAIKLAKLEWGPISVEGSTATATTYETWTTTYADGSTEQSRDQNDYSLVLDSGTWKISADAHPESQVGVPGPGTPPDVQPDPRFPANRNSSHNWSGYATTAGNYTSVTGTWTVPDFTADGSFGVDAAWVGIGGVRSRDLIQAGTQQTVSGSGRTQYQAWIEMLPAPSRPVRLSVHPGDSVSVSIQEESPDNWLISFTNHTTGQTYQTRQQYTSSHSSAEWVEEAPSAAGRGGGLLPLSDFGTLQFTDGAAVKDGQTVSIADSGARAITMINANGEALAVPSDLGQDGSSFSVARTEAQATTSAGRGGLNGAFPRFPRGRGTSGG